MPLRKKKSRKHEDMVTLVLFYTLPGSDAPRTLKQALIKAEVSTARSDEESHDPRATLSFPLPSLPNGLPRYYQSGSNVPVKWPCL